MTDLAATIGDRIRRARTRADLTQAELAEVAHLNRSSIANVEVGKQNLPVDKLMAIAAHLGTSVAALIGEVPLDLPPRVRITADGWVVRCEECGQLGLVLTRTGAEAMRDTHLRKRHGVGNDPA